MKSKLTKTEQDKVKNILLNLTDLYAEFYLTISNLRVFIKENLDLLFDKLDEGDKITYNDRGILIINGFADNRDRKYIKLIYEDLKVANSLLEKLEDINIEVFIKIKRNNPLKTILEKNGFKLLKNRGKEILMIKNKSKEK